MEGISRMEDEKRLCLSGDEAINIWEQGKEAWNSWVEANPVADVDFSNVDFSKWISINDKKTGATFEGFAFPNGNISFEGATFFFGGLNFCGANFGDGKVDFTKIKFVLNTNKHPLNNIINFTGVTFGNGDVFFTKTQFHGGKLIFTRSTFGDGNVDFTGVLFNNVNFTGVAFGKGNVDFTSARFSEGANFFDATFDKGNVDFTEAKFGNGNVDFTEANFGEGDVNFCEATFGNGDVDFTEARFGNGYVDFTEATFGNGYVDFTGATFGNGDVIFTRAYFGEGDVNFSRATFGDGNVDFNAAVFGDGDAYFVKVTFGNGNLSFSNINCTGRFNFTNMSEAPITNFRNAIFNNAVIISNVSFRGIPDLVNTKLTHQLSLHDVVYSLPRQNFGYVLKKAKYTEDAPRLNRLKELAETNKHHNLALRCHADEHRAQRWHTMGIFESLLDCGFSAVCNYGQVVWRPFFILLLFIMLFTVPYTLQSDSLKLGTNFNSELLIFSAANSMPFLTSARSAREKGIKKIFEGDGTPASVDATIMAQGAISVILLFLIGLGLRNRFRL
jgi:hypothetical protein